MRIVEEEERKRVVYFVSSHWNKLPVFLLFFEQEVARALEGEFVQIEVLEVPLFVFEESNDSLQASKLDPLIRPNQFLTELVVVPQNLGQQGSSSAYCNSTSRASVKHLRVGPEGDLRLENRLVELVVQEVRSYSVSFSE